MHYNQLTQEQRYHISSLLKSPMLQKDIAKEIGVHKSTISRELRRNEGERGYRPKQAGEKADFRKHHAKKHIKFTDAIKKFVTEKIKEDWSPDEIRGYLKAHKLPGIGTERIYQFILADKKVGGTLYKHLRHSGKIYKKRYGSHDRRGQIKNRISIHDRPTIVEEKTRLGDWEGDTIIGAKQQKAIVTLVDRVSKKTLIGRVGTKHSEFVSDIVISLLSPIKTISHTITFDNGKEFSGHEIIAKKLKVGVYFADPYSSWQRGLNENTNGLIRQYIPKGSSFDNISDEYIVQIQNKLNNRPRKTLGYKTPNEVEAFNKAMMRPG